jgi:bacteriorhodopsin
MYLVVIIQARGALKTPGLAIVRFLKHHLYGAIRELWRELSQWTSMPTTGLKARFALFRKLNTSMCFFTALVALLATTRWLHVGNVNGFRYLGYALTCPLMQAELVMMIAPVVPCYRFTVVLVAFVTFSCMVTGYAASLLSEDLYEGSLEDFLSTWDIDDLALTRKFMVLLPSLVGITFLTFLQLPYLSILYAVKGGVSAGLPHNFQRLIFLVAVTWMGFPIWWFLNWQGMGIITDAKLNGAGFCLLNIISKGAFTFTVTSSSAWHRQHGWTPEAIAQGKAGTTNENTAASNKEHASPTGTESRRSCSSVSSCASCFPPAEEPPWFVNLLSSFDSDQEVEPTSPTSPRLDAFVKENSFIEEDARSTRSPGRSPPRPNQEDIRKLITRVEKLCSAFESDGFDLKSYLRNEQSISSHQTWFSNGDMMKKVSCQETAVLSHESTESTRLEDAGNVCDRSSRSTSVDCDDLHAFWQVARQDARVSLKYHIHGAHTQSSAMQALDEMPAELDFPIEFEV